MKHAAFALYGAFGAREHARTPCGRTDGLAGREARHARRCMMSRRGRRPPYAGPDDLPAGRREDRPGRSEKRLGKPDADADAGADAGADADMDDASEAGKDGRGDGSGQCPYCLDVRWVDCPVCEGRGYHGRTIVCYYCQGARRIECPLCVDDIYKFSYVKRTEPVGEGEGDGDGDRDGDEDGDGGENEVEKSSSGF